MLQDAPTKIPEGIVPFLDWFYIHYGSKGTLALVLGIPTVIIIFQIWLRRRQGREINIALEAKEQTIERLADENREDPAILFKDKLGLTDAQIDKLMKPSAAKIAAPEKGRKKGNAK